MLLRQLLVFFPVLIIPLAGTLLTAAPAIWPLTTLLYNLGLFFLPGFCACPQSGKAAAV